MKEKESEPQTSADNNKLNEIYNDNVAGKVSHGFMKSFCSKIQNIWYIMNIICVL